MKNWDAADSNMDSVAGSHRLPAQWAADAAAYRTSGVAIDKDIPYGDTEELCPKVGDGAIRRQFEVA
jgi:hypothetical protein